MGKVLNGHLSKEDIRTANQGMKRCPTSYVIGKYNDNNNNSTMPGHTCENGQNPRRRHHRMLAGLQHGAATLEDGSMVSYKTEHALGIQPSNRTPCYLPAGVGHWCAHENLHTGFDSSFIYNCQHLEATKMSSRRREDEKDALPDNGISLITKGK